MAADTNDKKHLILSWVGQVIAAGILGMAAWGKITGAEGSIYVFESLEMEPSGRIIIGIIESLAAIMLLTTNIPHLGALLGFSVMIGATFAHISVLGLDVQGDGGKLVMMLILVLISTSIVMTTHRKKLPFVGKTF
ncbi:MAG: DoxX family protein [Proteobacteria bacterium]|nr:DoxX family protein [Pseudomonadota bacterium]